MCIDIIKNITDYPTGECRAGFGWWSRIGSPSFACFTFQLRNCGWKRIVQILGINRLQYVINNTSLDRKSCIFEIAESADHTDFAVDVKFFRLFLELYSVHDGHFHICDNNVRMLFENDLQAIFGIICFQKITVCSDLSHGVLNFRIRNMKKLGSRLWIRKVLPPPPCGPTTAEQRHPRYGGRLWMSVERPILAIFNDTDTDSNGKSSERLSADLCDKYGLSVRFLVVTEKDFMVQDSTSVTLISSWNPSV